MGDDRSSHWVSAVPEIFYDLIARVLPGAVAWLMGADLYLSFRLWIEGRPGVLAWSATGASAVILSVGMLAACWVVGLLLTPLGDGVWRGPRTERIFLEIVGQHRELLKRAEERGLFDHGRGAGIWAAENESALREDLIALSRTIYQQIHEYLKDRREVWRNMLTKNQAEVTFYANVAATMRWMLLGTIPLVWAACFVKGVRIGAVGMRNWAGFALTAVLPMALFLWSARKGLMSKQPRLWTRHMACLAVDLMPSGNALWVAGAASSAQGSVSRAEMDRVPEHISD